MIQFGEKLKDIILNSVHSTKNDHGTKLVFNCGQKTNIMDRHTIQHLSDPPSKLTKKLATHLLHTAFLSENSLLTME